MADIFTYNPPITSSVWFQPNEEEDKVTLNFDPPATYQSQVIGGATYYTLHSSLGSGTWTVSSTGSLL